MPDPTQQLDEILARCEKATEGPWWTAEEAHQAVKAAGYGAAYSDHEWYEEPIHRIVQPLAPPKDDKHKIYCNVPMAFCLTRCPCQEDIDFIAHARTDLPRVAKALKLAMLALHNIRIFDPAVNRDGMDHAITHSEIAADSYAKISAALGGQDEQA